MCCFRLHFSDFNVLFFQKIKNFSQFTFEKKITCCAKREKNNFSQGKILAPPPPWISNGPSLTVILQLRWPQFFAEYECRI